MNESERTPPTDCYEGDPELLPVAEALRRIDARATSISGHERVALRDALGRVAAEAIVSPMNVPGHTNSAMDGYALAGADLPMDTTRRLTVLGTAWAGRPFDGKLLPGSAVRVMTGAVMPPGTDTVIMNEQVEKQVDRQGDAIVIGEGHRVGQNVRQAGEDIAIGDRVLAAGKRIMPAELGLLGSLSGGYGWHSFPPAMSCAPSATRSRPGTCTTVIVIRYTACSRAWASNSSTWA
jgi:molybdopterin molybdotransferase